MKNLIRKLVQPLNFNFFIFDPFIYSIQEDYNTMKKVNTAIELKNSQILDEACVIFRGRHCMERVATKMAMSANVLRNKFNPDSEYHKLSLLESVVTAGITGDVSVLQSAISMLGFGIFKIDEQKSDSSILHCVFSSIGASATIANLYDKAMADGVVDDKERNSLLNAVTDAERKLKELRAKLTVKVA